MKNYILFLLFTHIFHARLIDQLNCIVLNWLLSLYDFPEQESYFYSSPTHVFIKLIYDFHTSYEQLKYETFQFKPLTGQISQSKLRNITNIDSNCKFLFTRQCLLYNFLFPHPINDRVHAKLKFCRFCNARKSSSSVL